MFTEEERRFALPRKLADRLVVFVFGCVLTGFFGLLLFSLEGHTTADWLEKLVLWVAVETMFTFTIFSLLALIWALFTPHWLESLLGHGLRKVLTTIAVVLIATVFTVLYFML